MPPEIEPSKEHIVTLRSPPDRMLHLWFEPWAEGLAFPPDMLIELHATSSLPGQLELDETAERTAVYAWAGSTLRVVVDGKLVESFDIAVPEALARLSTKEAMTMLFGAPPVPTASEGAHVKKRAWWRLWE